MSHNSHSWGRILMRELDGLVPLWRSNFEIISTALVAWKNLSFATASVN